MDNVARLEFIEALRRFKDSYSIINVLWDSLPESADLPLDDYPFNKSFDEYGPKLNDWCKKSIEMLQGLNEDAHKGRSTLSMKSLMDIRQVLRVHYSDIRSLTEEEIASIQCDIDNAIAAEQAYIFQKAIERAVPDDRMSEADLQEAYAMTWSITLEKPNGTSVAHITLPNYADVFNCIEELIRNYISDNL